MGDWPPFRIVTSEAVPVDRIYAFSAPVRMTFEPAADGGSYNVRYHYDPRTVVVARQSENTRPRRRKNPHRTTWGQQRA